jgi:hypothetical protein
MTYEEVTDKTNDILQMVNIKKVIYFTKGIIWIYIKVSKDKVTTF